MVAMNRAVFPLLVLLLLIVLIACSNAVHLVDEEETGRVGSDPWDFITVTGSVVNLRSGPGTEFPILGQVLEGESLQVTGGLEEWYRIYVPGLSLFAWIYGPLTSGTVLP
jgi:uncharacterized protein YgiM (DUF1202 family)